MRPLIFACLLLSCQGSSGVKKVDLTGIDGPSNQSRSGSGEVDVVATTLRATPTTLPADDTTQTIALVTVKGNNAELVDGVAVTFVVSAGTLVSEGSVTQDGVIAAGWRSAVAGVHQLTATIGSGSDQFTKTVDVTFTAVGSGPTLSYTSPNALLVGSAITPLTPTTANLTPPLLFVAPTLPGGLTIDASTGVIAGTPATEAATADYTVTVSDAIGGNATAVVALTVAAACAGTCVPSVPSGWSAPLMVANTCAAPYTKNDGIAYGGLHFPSPSCNCDCLIINCAINVPFYSNSSCGSVTGGGFNDGTDVCFGQVPSGTYTGTLARSPPECVPQPAQPTTPPFTADRTLTTCAGPAGAVAAAGACESGLACVASAPSGPLCVRQSGDVPCPAGFPSRELAYDDVVNQTNCSSCNACPGATLCGNFHAYNYTGTDCTGSASEITTTCQPAATSVRLTHTAGSCGPSAGPSPATGGWQASNPVTFCCVAL